MGSTGGTALLVGPKDDVTDPKGWDNCGACSDGVEVWAETAPACRSDGGMKLGGSSLGGSFPRTFSASRNMASANCSAFSFPLLVMSHKFLFGETGR